MEQKAVSLELAWTCLDPDAGGWAKKRFLRPDPCLAAPIGARWRAGVRVALRNHPGASTNDREAGGEELSPLWLGQSTKQSPSRRLRPFLVSVQAFVVTAEKSRYFTS